MTPETQALRDALLKRFDEAAWTATGSYANVTFVVALDALIASASMPDARLREALEEALDIAEAAEACCDGQFRITADPPCETCRDIERLRAVIGPKP